MNNLIELINKENFKLAEIELNNKSFPLCKSAIEEEAYTNPNIKLYHFLIYIIAKTHNNKEYHEFTSELMATALNHIENSYYKALIHAKEVVRIEPNSIKNWEWLLFFHDIPEKVISKKELSTILIKILNIDSDNLKAKKKLEKEFSQDEIIEIMKNIT